MDSTGKPTIMIVEDEVIIYYDLSARLESMGYRVLSPEISAEAALARMERETPDLVLMDIALAGKLDGLEAARLIRERWGIPVVIASAHSDTQRLEQAKLSEPYGYILKPFRDKDVRVTVEMALNMAG